MNLQQMLEEHERDAAILTAYLHRTYPATKKIESTRLIEAMDRCASETATAFDRLAGTLGVDQDTVDRLMVDWISGKHRRAFDARLLA
jgi:hypothetical protein